MAHDNQSGNTRKKLKLFACTRLILPRMKKPGTGPGRFELICKLHHYPISRIGRLSMPEKILLQLGEQ